MTERKDFTAFSHLLDQRILRSLASLKFTHPTDVQAQAIPLALSGKDVLARSRTGSGKTLAYGIPLVNSILSTKSKLANTDLALHATRALILVPTRELAEQVANHLRTLAGGLGDENLVRVCNVAGGASAKGKGKPGSDKVQRMQLTDKPDVVVATPSRALVYLRSKLLDIAHLESLVIDEADLILSYGHSADDIRAILSGTWNLPTVYQSFLMSATMTTDVEELQGVVLRNPAVLDIEDKEDELANLAQYSVRCTEVDKFLLLYVIFKLKLIRGKCLVFVNDTDRSYRVKLFLEKFGIKAGVLNAELPFNSRFHAVQEFNRGVFDYLIATDEAQGVKEEDDEPAMLLATEPTVDGGAPTAGPSKSRKRKRNDRDEAGASEYGVSRGIDFIDVACVVNFDLPSTTQSYTHRIGRTARAGRSGTALSFVVPKDVWGKREKGLVDVGVKSAKHDERVCSRIEEAQDGRVKEYKFDMAQVNGFRYRMEDALRSVTTSSIREARIREIKNEVVNSERLKAHFEDNPADLAYLRHDKPLHPSRIQPHLKHIPSYLMPRIAAVGPASNAPMAAEGEKAPRVGFRKDARGRGRGKRGGKFSGGPGRRKEDPLKSFKK